MSFQTYSVCIHEFSFQYLRCMLHNFAGNVEMYGVLDAVGSGPVEARTSENSTMVSLAVLVLGFHSSYNCVSNTEL